MKKHAIGANSIIIIFFCMIVLISLGLIFAGNAFASEEEVYDPYNHEDDSFYVDVNNLKGSFVPVSKDLQAMIQYNISSGGSKYKGSGECWGYAEKTRKLFGRGSGRKTVVKKKSTKANLYKYLKNVKPGTHVRFGYYKNDNGAHSIALYKVTKDKIYYSDANIDQKNSIEHNVEDLDDFDRGYRYILWYIQPTGSYKTVKAKTVTSVYDSENKVDVACQPVSGAKSYTIYRSSSKNGKYKKLKTVKSPIFTDKDPLIGTNYYKIKPNNRSVSSPKKALNKLVIPTVHVKVTNQGNSKLYWDAIKGAKKYNIYKVKYGANDKPKYKLYKTVTDCNYTYKGKGGTFAVRAIASNSKAHSGYVEFPCQRYLPKPKIISGEVDRNDGRFIINVMIPYSLKRYEFVNINLYRSDSKNGEYEYITTESAYDGMLSDESFGSQYYRDTFDPSASVIKVGDENWKENTTYYYKVVASSDNEEARSSAVFKVTTPERTPIDEGNSGSDISDPGSIEIISDDSGNESDGWEDDWWDDWSDNWPEADW